MNDMTIPTGALERLEVHGSGHWARLDRRRWQIRQATQPLLLAAATPTPATGVLAEQAQSLGQELVRAVWQLHARLEAHEAAQHALQREADALSDERAALAGLPDEDAPGEQGRLRQAELKLRSEERAEAVAWLDARSDVEKRVAEILREYAGVARKLALVTQQPAVVPTLCQLLGFLTEPPAETVYLPLAEECDQLPPRRLP
jgi:hypothetical protein